MCLCLSVSDFDRYSLTIARWLTTLPEQRATTEIYTIPRDVTIRRFPVLPHGLAGTGLSRLSAVGFRGLVAADGWTQLVPDLRFCGTLDGFWRLVRAFRTLCEVLLAGFLPILARAWVC